MRTFWIALLSGGLLWLSFPPVGWWFLAWLALIPLISLIRPTGDLTSADEKKTVRSKYWMLWLAGTAYWLGTLYFIPLPHPSLWIGWAALSMYCGLYTPLFVGISRTLVHQYRWPVALVVPVVFTGMEWVRSNFATGFAMVCLSHSQFRNPTIIQVADIFGAYTLTFLMSLFAVCISQACVVSSVAGRGESSEVLKTDFRKRIAYLLFGGIVALGVFGYGRFQVNKDFRTASIPVNVGLIQSSMDVIFVQLTAEQQEEHWRQLLSLTDQAVQAWPDLHLIVWPESSLLLHDLLSDFNEEVKKSMADKSIRSFWEEVNALGGHNPISLIVGSTTHHPSEKQMFNSALLIEAPGEVSQRYFKNHRVLFGEYVPLSDWLPLLEKTPIGRGLTPGSDFNTFEIRNVRFAPIRFAPIRFAPIRFAPSICFESTVPHLIRRMINRLSDQGKEPDVMINLTNDGWFFGTSCLDFHLACNVFRAVEMRKPHLVCANTGFSAEIDDEGKILQQGPRRETEVLRAVVHKAGGRTSLYRTMGDVVPGTFGCVSLLLWLLAGWRKSPLPERKIK